MSKKIELPSFLSRVSSQQKINFARHLSVGIKSGMPLLEALELIRQQAESKKLSSITSSLIKDINNGQSLTDSLAKFKKVFGDFFINMVRVGEAGGNLAQSLLFLSGELKKQREVSRRVRSALIYPAIIFVATLGIAGFLVFFIFPKIIPILSSLNVELPFTTVLVIETLKFFNNNGIWVLLGVIALAILFKVFLSMEKIHFQFDKLLISLPFMSSMIVNVTLTNFSRSLAVLLKSGMTLVDALEVAKATFHNKFYRAQIEEVIETVKRGEEMTRYFASRPKLFPPMLVGMIKVGEGTGNLEQNLFYLSEYYESEVDETIKTLTTTIEPLLLLLMGIMVGFVALSIITPIYQVTQGIR